MLDTRRLFVSIVVASIVSLLAPLVARAQTTPVPEYHVAVAADATPLRSGDLDYYYKVAELPAGRVLVVDAEGGGWARVHYPTDVPVVVLASDVGPTDGKTVTLAKSSALKSRHLTAGFAQSWQRAVPRGSELPAGTTLTVVESIRGEDGKVAAYAVLAPEQARAYVQLASTRRATQAEIDAFLSTPAPAPLATDTSTAAPEVTPPTGATPTGAIPQPAEGEVLATDSAPGPAENPTESLLEPIRIADVPTEDGGVLAPPVVPTDASTEDVTIISQAPSTDPTQRPVGSLQELEAAFQRVRTQPELEAEFEEVGAEFRRTMQSLGGTPNDQRLRQSLEQRAQYIDMLASLREAKRVLAERRAAAVQGMEQVSVSIGELERTRGYSFVGRLVESQVYDGTRLPRMYRIVSVTGAVPRTIGYIAPTPEMDLSGRLGRVVGILGESHLDEALQLRIVRPTRIDILTPAETGAAP